MARDRNQSNDYAGPLRRLLLAVLVLLLAGVLVLWRIDSPRVERFRAQVTDTLVPNLDWAMAPVTGTVNLLSRFPQLSAPFGAKSGTSLRAAPDADVEGGRTAAGAGKRAPARSQQRPPRPAPDLCDWRGAGRFRFALPAVRPPERWRTRWAGRGLGHDGRHRPRGPHFRRGREYGARDPCSPTPRAVSRW